MIKWWEHVTFEQIDALTKEEAKEAVINPAEDFGVSYTEEALERIVQTTD